MNKKVDGRDSFYFTFFSSYHSLSVAMEEEGEGHGSLTT